KGRDSRNIREARHSQRVPASPGFSTTAGRAPPERALAPLSGFQLRRAGRDYRVSVQADQAQCDAPQAAEGALLELLIAQALQAPQRGQIHLRGARPRQRRRRRRPGQAELQDLSAAGRRWALASAVASAFSAPSAASRDSSRSW